MAKIDEKIDSQTFTVTTSKGFVDIRRLGQEAAERSAGLMTKVVERGAVDGERIAYNVKRVGAFTVLDFDLLVKESDDDSRTVTLRVGDYVTSQATVLGFIPVGPKDAVGLGPLRNFSTAMRKLLS